MINIYELLEWCLTSSVLILLIMIIRLITKKHISPVLRYGLWLVVLIRLLLPFNPLESIFSIMNPAESLINSSDVIRPVIDLTRHSESGFYYDSNYILHYQAAITSWRYLIYGIWCYGMFIVADNMIFNNWKLWRKLKLERKPLLDHTDPTRPRLYGLEGLASPCLFGLRHPSIYLNGAALSDPVVLEHALAHERAHYRHGDHIWSILRLLALILHWYNPLVWIACSLSKLDGEAAADDLAVRTLGEDQRLAYGQTLLQLVSSRARTFSILSISTTMVTGMISSKRALRKRILSIARMPRTTRLSAVIVSLLMLASILCTFTGAEASTWFDTDTPFPQSYVSSGTKPIQNPLPLCDTLRANLRASCSEYDSVDLTDQFLEMLDYDKIFFNDVCVYQYEDGSIIGAFDIRSTDAGDLGFPIKGALETYAEEQGLRLRSNLSPFEYHFFIHPNERTELTSILDKISQYKL